MIIIVSNIESVRSAIVVIVANAVKITAKTVMVDNNFGNLACVVVLSCGLADFASISIAGYTMVLRNIVV
jgi:hypothetical protein